MALNFVLMKPLIVLMVTFGLSLLIGRLVTAQWPFIISGNIAMCMMLLFPAVGHFKFPRGMAMMVPSLFRFKTEIVMISGLLEIILGLLLLFPPTRFYSGVLLIAMFLLMLPANISAARRRVNYETAQYDGPGPGYLWFRIPMQVLLIAWIWYFAVKDFL